MRTRAPEPALRGLAAAVLTLLCACTATVEATPPLQGRADVGVIVAGSPAVARVVLTVGPGDGSPFPPFTLDLLPAAAGWSARVPGVPAGPGRLFAVAALDAAGAVLLSGSARSDVVPGASAAVTIWLSGAPPPPFENAMPVVDYLGVSRTRVPAGTSASLRVSAHDPDGDPVTYLWAASCGAFDAPAAKTVTWTAPGAAPATCQLSISVSDGRGATLTVPLEVAVVSGRVVVGTRLVTAWPDPPSAPVTGPALDVASAPAPVALTRDATGAWVEHPGGHELADGTFVPGQYGPDGSFAIPEAPLGAYALCLQEGGSLACTDTSRDRVDLGVDRLGRPGLAFPAAATPVTLALSGLDAWNPETDLVQLTSSAAGLWHAFAPGLRGGDVGGDAVVDWFAPGGGAPLPLLSGGDLLQVHQLSTRSFYLGRSLVLYVAATAAGQVDPALTSGQARTLPVQLAPLPLGSSLSIDWDTGLFEQHLAAMGPAGRTALAASPHALVVGASAHRLEYPAPAATGAPELVRLALPPGAGRVPATLSHGRFLPPLWGEWRSARFTARVTYTAPGATEPIVEDASIERREPLVTAPVLIGPAVTPVRSPLVDGHDALAEVTGPLTTTPTISWTAPAVGVPTAYLVEVHRLDPLGTATVRTRVLRYATSALHVTVPPGVLQPGATYFARISAQVSTVPFDLAPLRSANVYALADVLSAPFSP